MSYQLSISIALGGSKTGLTLGFQLINPDGTSNGTTVSTTVVEVGHGYYLWTYDFPSGFRGGVKVFDQASPSVVLALLSINPQETENSDMKLSDAVSAIEASAPDINIEVGHSNAKGFVAYDKGSNNNKVTVNTGVR